MHIVLKIAVLGILTHSPIVWGNAKVMAHPDALRDFTRAKTLMNEGKESEALLSFADFLRRYPNDPMAAEVQYLNAELFFRMREFKKAEAEYRKVFSHKEGRPELLANAGLRLGECWHALGDQEKARIEWSAVLRRFNGSAEGEKAKILLGTLL